MRDSPASPGREGELSRPPRGLDEDGLPVAMGRSRVLLLVTLSEWGGAQHVVYLLARHLRQHYDVSVACAPGGQLVERLGREGVRVIAVPEFVRALHPWRDLAALVRLVRLIRQERYDIVHAHSTKAGFLGRLAARLAGVPVVLFTAHGWAFTEGRVWWKRAALALVERFCGLLSTTLVCVSRHDHDLARRFRVASAGRLVTIRPGVDPAPFGRVDPRAARLALGIRSGPVVGFIGRLARPKEPLDLLEAMSRLSQGTLLIAGAGPLRPKIERFARRHALEDRVLLLGSREDVPDLLAAMDIFVLPSRWEGLPLAVIEAMMAGLPVLATAVGGVPELVEDGVTGLLVPPRDPEALAWALARLLSDPPLRRRMGAAGREKALREFRIDRMLEETSRLYEGLLATARRRAGAAPVPRTPGSWPAGHEHPLR